MLEYCGCLKLRLSLSVEALTLHSHCGYCVTPSSPVVGGANATLIGYTVQSQHTAFLDNLIFFVRVMTLNAHFAQASSEEWKADVWGNVSSFLLKLLHVLCCTAEFVCVMEFPSVFPVILVNSPSLNPQLRLCFLKSLDISWSRTFSLGFKTGRRLSFCNSSSSQPHGRWKGACCVFDSAPCNTMSDDSSKCTPSPTVVKHHRTAVKAFCKPYVQAFELCLWSSRGLKRVVDFHVISPPFQVAVCKL